MEFWEADLILTDKLVKMANDWHAHHFPRCRGSLKISNKCNHYRWFLDGCRCMELIVSENEARFGLKLTDKL